MLAALPAVAAVPKASLGAAMAAARPAKSSELAACHGLLEAGDGHGPGCQAGGNGSRMPEIKAQAPGVLSARGTAVPVIAHPADPFIPQWPLAPDQPVAAEILGDTYTDQEPIALFVSQQMAEVQAELARQSCHLGRGS